LLQGKSQSLLYKNVPDLHGDSLVTGFAAAEAAAAFDRARRLADRTTDASERYAASYGQWIGSFVRGELRVAKEAEEPNRSIRPD
jgi:hypothetical protein